MSSSFVVERAELESKLSEAETSYSELKILIDKLESKLELSNKEILSLEESINELKKMNI